MRKLKSLREADNSLTIEDKFNYLKEYPTYYTDYREYYTRPCKYYDLDLIPEQEDTFFKFLEEGGLDNFWFENEELSRDIYQAGRMGGHLILDNKVLDPNDFISFDDYNAYVEENSDYYELETIEQNINDAYNMLKDFDSRVDELIDNLKMELDGYVSVYEINSDDNFPKEESLNTSNKCVICGGDLGRYGNNAEPVAKGQCCDKCNQDKVIPARLKDMMGESLTEEFHDKMSVQEAIDFVMNSGDPERYPYMMLSRLQADNDYFLGASNGFEGHLWAGNIEDQIAVMKGI